MENLGKPFCPSTLQGMSDGDVCCPKWRRSSQVQARQPSHLLPPPTSWVGTRTGRDSLQQTLSSHALRLDTGAPGWPCQQVAEEVFRRALPIALHPSPLLQSLHISGRRRH